MATVHNSGGLSNQFISGTDVHFDYDAPEGLEGDITAQQQQPGGSTSNKKKKKKKKKKTATVRQEEQEEHDESDSDYPTSRIIKAGPQKSVVVTPMNPPTSTNINKKKKKDINSDEFWEDSSEGKQLLKEFWLSLSPDDQKNLVSKSKESVFRSIKDNDKVNCNCSFCGRKRLAIERELQNVYNSYFASLIDTATAQDREQLPDENTFNLAFADTLFDHFGPKNQGIFAIADDLLSNNGTKFLDMMEKLAERRMAREDFHHKQEHMRYHHHYEDGEGDDDEEEDDEDDDRPCSECGRVSHEYEDEDDGYYEDDDLEGDHDGHVACHHDHDYDEHGQLHGQDEVGHHHHDHSHDVVDDTDCGCYSEDMTHTLAHGSTKAELDRDIKKNFINYFGSHAHSNGRTNFSERRGDVQDDEELNANDEEAEEDGEEEEDEEDEEDEDYDESVDAEIRQDEARRLVKLLTTKMFHEGLLEKYKLKIANDRSNKLLEELELEEQRKKEKEEKKQKMKEKQKEKKRLQQLAKEEERTRKEKERMEAEKKAEEEKRKRAEEQRKKEEEKRLKKLEEQKKKQAEIEKAKKDKFEKERLKKEEKLKKKEEERKRRELEDQARKKAEDAERLQQTINQQQENLGALKLTHEEDQVLAEVSHISFTNTERSSHVDHPKQTTNEPLESQAAFSQFPQNTTPVMALPQQLTQFSQQAPQQLQHQQLQPHPQQQQPPFVQPRQNSQQDMMIHTPHSYPAASPSIPPGIPLGGFNNGPSASTVPAQLPMVSQVQQRIPPQNLGVPHQLSSIVPPSSEQWNTTMLNGSSTANLLDATLSHTGAGSMQTPGLSQGNLSSQPVFGNYPALVNEQTLSGGLGNIGTLEDASWGKPASDIWGSSVEPTIAMQNVTPDTLNIRSNSIWNDSVTQSPPQVSAPMVAPSINNQMASSAFPQFPKVKSEIWNGGNSIDDLSPTTVALIQQATVQAYQQAHALGSNWVACNALFSATKPLLANLVNLTMNQFLKSLNFPNPKFWFETNYDDFGAASMIRVGSKSESGTALNTLHFQPFANNTDLPSLGNQGFGSFNPSNGSINKATGVNEPLYSLWNSNGF